MCESLQKQQPKFNRFSEWCLCKEKLSNEVKHTIEVLLKKVGTSNCYEAEKLLNTYTELIFPYQKIADLSPISDLTNLRKLIVRQSKISDLSPLSGLNQLTHLEIVGYNGVDLNENQIYIYQSCLSNINPLSELSNLKFLDLSSNSIVNLTPLSRLINLEKLKLSGNGFICGQHNLDLSSLSELINLRELNLSLNLINNIAALSNLKQLTSLYLTNNPITDFQPLSKLINLQNLTIDCDDLVDIKLGLNILLAMPNLSFLSATQSKLEFSYLNDLYQSCPSILNLQINEAKVRDSLECIYAAIALEQPEIYFFSNFRSGIEWLVENDNLGKNLGNKIQKSTSQNLNQGMWMFLCKQINLPEREQNIWDALRQELDDYIEDNFICDFPDYILDLPFEGGMNFEQLFKAIGATELLVREFNYKLNENENKALESLSELLQSCLWIFPFEKVCIVCNHTNSSQILQ